MPRRTKSSLRSCTSSSSLSSSACPHARRRVSLCVTVASACAAFTRATRRMQRRRSRYCRARAVALPAHHTSFLHANNRTLYWATLTLTTRRCATPETAGARQGPPASAHAPAGCALRRQRQGRQGHGAAPRAQDLREGTPALSACAGGRRGNAQKPGWKAASRPARGVSEQQEGSAGKRSINQSKSAHERRERRVPSNRRAGAQ
jgi:hypothetical protein